MNTNLNTTTILQSLSAATVALVITWTLSWSFIDSTRLARWVSAADVAPTSTVVGSFKAGLLQ